MIKILCKRNYLSGYEKMQYAKAISMIIRELKELQAVIKEEIAMIEVEYSITIK